MLYFAVQDTTVRYLAEGVTEDVATTLGRVERLVVKTPAAVRRIQRLAPGNLRSIGAALGVRYLVDGGVRRVGARYHVTVRLVRAADEVTTWGDTYDRTADQLLLVPAEIASGVATVISGTLSQAERTAVGLRPTRDPRAYDEYVRSNFLIARRQAAPALLAVQAYERALQRDSTFVPALARAALAYALFLDWSWPFPGVPRDRLLARGDRLAERAVQLDPASSDAWLARGYVHAHERPQTLAGVLEALDSATRLDPRNAEAWHQYGYFRWVMYQDSAALDAFGRAIDVDPTRGITLEHIARVHFYARRYHEAWRWIDSALTVEPATPYFLLVRGRTELLLGEPDSARRDADLGAALSSDSATSQLAEITLGLVEIATGDSAAARRRAAALVGMFPDSGPIPYREGVWLATLLAHLADREAALDLLNRVRPIGPILGRFLVHPSFDALRADPRFQRLVIATAPPGGN